MYKCTILIPFVKEIEFLDGVLSQIENNEHAEVRTRVLVINQSAGSIKPRSVEIIQAHGGESVDCKQVDAGYPIDFGLGLIKDEFVCTLDADAFPISNTWLYEPIVLIEKHKLSFVGKQTGLHNHPDYKEKSNFYHINNYYRVSATALAKKVSKAVGFMRPNNHKKTSFSPVLKEYGFECDNGVVAQMYSDDYSLGDKFSYPINKILGMTNEVGIYGMVIDDKVFHMVFGFCEEYGLDKLKALGERYIEISDRIKNQGLSEETIRWLLFMLKDHPDGYHYWDCKKKEEISLTKEQYQQLLWN
jgi:hypothetical protein